MRTRIVATLGPSSTDSTIMRAMAENGVRIFRLNFSHSTAEKFIPVVQMIRQIEDEMGVPLTVLGDLCGPKIRIGEVQGSPLTIEKTCLVELALTGEMPRGDACAFITVDVPEVLKGLSEGMPVTLSDGMLQFDVEEVLEPDRRFLLRAHNSGLLTSHKGIAFPGKSHPLPALTDKDRVDLHEGLEIGIDAFAISFVQSRKDIEDIKEEIARHGLWVPVVAKIERQNAVENIESILELADAVMVARGDLGLECPLSEVPVIQKKIIRACRHAQKGCIVATQMLLSMVNNPVPTRAEATDVANAVLDGADCMMLSEETAVGQHPVEATAFIRDIAKNAEAYFLERVQGPYAPRKEKNLVKYMAYSACLLAETADSSALVAHSTSGATARLLSSRRPAHPIYALTTSKPVQRYLNFFWGVRPRLADTSLESHLERAQSWVSKSPLFTSGENVIITSGQPSAGQSRIHTNTIKVFYK
ncbi:pyruvate kinase [Desulfovibrio sp. X2]|uniref:pyruvate kinase n=1 Tax=Desulfovibrio sp. X2 TaxID=941449 RepID=UPI00054D7DDC|nr:pyruvate kinase [Desulfovibrio sp. X2]